MQTEKLERLLPEIELFQARFVYNLNKQLPTADEPVVVFIKNWYWSNGAEDYTYNWSELGRYNSYSVAKNVFKNLNISCDVKVCYLSTGEEVKEH